MFTILNGGKSAGSRVRFSKFYLIMKLGLDDGHLDANEIYHAISALIRKGISTTKVGEAGFKPNQSGSYYNAYDTINDSFKLLEEAIAATGVNTDTKKILSIGINAES